MTAPELSIRPCRPADVPAVAEMLARAFYDDPQFVWLLPQPARRASGLRRFFSTLLSVEAPGRGVVDVARQAGSEVAGAAIWFPPGTWPPPPGRQLLALGGYVRAFGMRLGKASTLVSAAARVHPHIPHWYLAAIGVEPARRGRKIASALLRARLATSDADGVPAYLESSKPANVPLYAHFGFVSAAPLAVPADAPLLIPMTRPPS